jgi:hypothetical protein
LIRGGIGLANRRRELKAEAFSGFASLRLRRYRSFDMASKFRADPDEVQVLYRETCTIKSQVGEPQGQRNGTQNHVHGATIQRKRP